jgi:N-methylhydantoinase A/oxoprolinase/acetone carboxylase beta subunit
MVRANQAVAIKHKDEILQRVAEGDRLSDIAEKYGVTAMAISKQLTNDPEYQAVREIAALKRIEKWEKELEAINPKSSAVMMQRADRMLAHSRWRAEKEHRQYAAKQENQGTTIQVIISDPTKTVTIDQDGDEVSIKS